MKFTPCSENDLVQLESTDIDAHFDSKVMKLAEKLSQQGHMCDAGIQYQTFAYLKLLHQESEKYEPIISMMKINFTKTIADAEGALDVICSTAVAGLAESNFELVAEFIDSALHNNHPLEIYSPVPSFESVLESVEDTIHMEKFDNWMQQTILTEIHRIGTLFKDGDLTYEGIIELLVLMHQYYLCSEHGGYESDMAFNKVVIAITRYPETAYEAIRAAFTSRFMNMYQFYKFIERKIIQNDPEFVAYVNPKFDYGFQPGIVLKSPQWLKQTFMNSEVYGDHEPIVRILANTNNNRDRLRLFMAVFKGIKYLWYNPTENLTMFFRDHFDFYAAAFFKTFDTSKDNELHAHLLKRIAPIASIFTEESSDTLLRRAKTVLDDSRFSENPEFMMYVLESMPEDLLDKMDFMDLAMNGLEFDYVSVIKFVVKHYCVYMRLGKLIIFIKNTIFRDYTSVIRAVVPNLMKSRDWPEIHKDLTVTALASSKMATFDYLFGLEEFELPENVLDEKIGGMLIKAVQSGYAENRIIRLYKLFSVHISSNDLKSLLEASLIRDYERLNNELNHSLQAIVG